MKQLFIVLFFILFIFSSCENDKKLTAYLKPLTEDHFKIGANRFINDVSFLFIVDTSGSMSEFNTHLSENVKLFLDPIFANFPYFNYNFAITTMTPSSEFKKNHPLFFNNELIKECGLNPSLFSHTVNVGSYLSYSIDDLQKFSYKQLVCIVSQSIKTAQGFDSATESFFQSISYIIDKADKKFKHNFFGKDKFLILFFISDTWEGVDYNSIRDQFHAGDKIATDRLNKIQSVMGGSVGNIRSYAVVMDDRRKDDCGEGNGGSDYPFHLYSFIEKTQGLRISICDASWGKQLTDVFDDFRIAFFSRILYLEEVPQRETLEVFFDNKKVPKDTQTGWFFNPEGPSVVLGPQFDFYSYFSGDSLEEAEVIVKYHPVNIEILGED